MDDHSLKQLMGYFSFISLEFCLLRYQVVIKLLRSQKSSVNCSIVGRNKIMVNFAVDVIPN